MKKIVLMYCLGLAVAAMAGSAAANTMEMTRTNVNRAESIVGEEGTTTSTADIKFSVDFQYTATDGNADQGTGFGIKLHQVSTGSGNGTNIFEATDPGLLLHFNRDREDPTTVDLVLHDGVTTDGILLDTVEYDWDTDWHRLDFYIVDGAGAATAFVNIDGDFVLFGETEVSKDNYDFSTGRNFQIVGEHRLEGTPVQFDNIRINDSLLEDFEGLTSIDQAGGADWVVRNRFNFMSLNTGNDSIAVPVELSEFIIE